MLGGEGGCQSVSPTMGATALTEVKDQQHRAEEARTRLWIVTTSLSPTYRGEGRGERRG